MQIIFYTLIIFFFSCSKISTDSLEGTWYYNQKLFLKEQELLKSPKADLSDMFKTIKMVFDDTQFISYLDNQITKGQWKIENNLLHMFLENHGWMSYTYKYSGNQLIIYDREFIIALERKK